MSILGAIVATTLLTAAQLHLEQPQPVVYVVQHVEGPVGERCAG